ncbi:MAG: NifU family protein [Alphaproteobacteria bacterium]|nr:NifU family protein [Alphaproteobacteria bacterium]
MFIQTLETPNPNTLKFVPNRPVYTEAMQGASQTYTVDDDLSLSPFAKKVLHIEGVEKIFFGNDFIAVTKQDDADWFMLKPHLLGTMMEHFVNDLPVIDISKISGQHQQVPSENTLDELSQKIMGLIDTRIRPAVAQDGGDIVFDSFIDGIVYVKMKGACSGCPSSTLTLKRGIENMLKFYVPEVQEVQHVED